MTIPMGELEVGGIYKLARTRNLLIGVWNGATFVGIREKFHYVYLDSSELAPQATEKLGHLPEGVSVEECFWDDKGNLLCSNAELFKVLAEYERAENRPDLPDNPGPLPGWEDDDDDET